MNTSGQPLAKCYLKNEGDENNVCHLFEDHLQVIFKGRMNSFFINWINDVSLKHRIFLGPIILGGIVTSLSGVGLFTYYMNPWLLIFTVFAGLFSIYYGYTGGISLMVVTPIKEYDFFVFESTENLKAFVTYLQQHIKGVEVQFYFKIDESALDEAHKIGHLNMPKEGIVLYNTAPKAEAGQVIVKLNTHNLPVEIRYIQQQGAGMVPMLFADIPIAHISKVY